MAPVNIALTPQQAAQAVITKAAERIGSPKQRDSLVSLFTGAVQGINGRLDGQGATINYVAPGGLTVSMKANEIEVPGKSAVVPFGGKRKLVGYEYTEIPEHRRPELDAYREKEVGKAMQEIATAQATLVPDMSPRDVAKALGAMFNEVAKDSEYGHIEGISVSSPYDNWTTELSCEQMSKPLEQVTDGAVPERSEVGFGFY